VSPTKQKEAKNNIPRRKKRGLCQQDRPVVEPNAAGIDVGAREMYVAIPPDRDPDPVRVFKTFTADLEALIDWLVERGITTVAMEATGVYWIPLYQMLEDRGVRACLVNARHMKNVPGRRTDWHECQWLQYLHATGLLRPAFRPDQDVCAVRTLLRHRNELVRMAAQHVQHMQKALTQMNVHIHHVISDITGLTGIAIVDAILAGERDVAKLAALRIVAFRRMKRRSASPWRATGVRNIFSLCTSPARCTQIVESTSRPVIRKLRKCWGILNPTWTSRHNRCRHCLVRAANDGRSELGISVSKCVLRPTSCLVST